ncbi:MAG: ImmA/IrrE family metallo-endopeptidase [Anaerolineae bacterium]|nr:ImmA/IrrE family metallo-endopeptidase [Anaerolineae bacterium]
MLLSIKQNDLVLMLRYIEEKTGSGQSEARLALRQTQTNNRAELPTDSDLVSVIEALDYQPDEFSIPHYVDHLRHALNRDIDLVAIPFSESLSGAYVHVHEQDFIFYNKGKHPLIQEHTVVHESAHIVLKHEGYRFRGGELHDELMALLKNVVGHCRTRNAPGVEEQEAEQFANLLLTRIRQGSLQRYLHKTANTNLFPPFDRL